jgi:hypothetical protein
MLRANGVSERETARVCQVDRRSVRNLTTNANAQGLPFSSSDQPPANNPLPDLTNDQPRPPQRRAYDPRYHGHTYRTFAAPVAFEGWDLTRVRNALALHNQGNFIESSTLALKVLAFPPVMAALGQRMAPALALPRHVRAGDRGLSRVLGLAVESQLTPREGLYPSNVFPATLYGSTQFDLAMMGFAVWQHAFGEPDPDTGIRPLYTRRWPTWAVQYYRYRRTYVALTADGPVDIVNDGKFTLVADNEEPHFFGAILALAEEALDGLSTRRARASWIDKYGSPKWIATMPQGTATNSDEGEAMMEALATIRSPEGFGAVPYGTVVKAESIAAGQSTVLNDALASNWQNVAATLLGSDGTMTRGTGVYSAPIFAGVRRDLVDRDLKAITRGINQGHIGTWLGYNYSQSIAANRGEWIQPVLDIPLPDPDADARIKSYADRVKSFHEIIEKERAANFEMTQERVNQLAKSLEIDAPTLAPVDKQISRIELAPTDIAKVVKVSEARASQGLPPMNDERDDKTIAEMDADAKAAAKSDESAVQPAGETTESTEPTNQTGDATGNETKTGSTSPATGPS